MPPAMQAPGASDMGMNLQSQRMPLLQVPGASHTVTSVFSRHLVPPTWWSDRRVSACPRCRYLVPEFEDAAFGPRASAVHTALQEALLGSADAAHVLSAIPKQMEVVAMLRHINCELKVPHQSPNPACLLLIARRPTAVSPQKRLPCCGPSVAQTPNIHSHSNEQ